MLFHDILKRTMMKTQMTLIKYIKVTKKLTYLSGDLFPTKKTNQTIKHLDNVYFVDILWKRFPQYYHNSQCHINSGIGNLVWFVIATCRQTMTYWVGQFRKSSYFRTRSYNGHWPTVLELFEAGLDPSHALTTLVAGKPHVVDNSRLVVVVQTKLRLKHNKHSIVTHTVSVSIHKLCNFPQTWLHL